MSANRCCTVLLPCLALIALMSACQGGHEPAAKKPDASTTGQSSAKGTGCPGDNAGLTLPDGFCAGIFADSLVHARDIVVAPNGDVYVALEGNERVAIALSLALLAVSLAVLVALRGWWLGAIRP